MVTISTVFNANPVAELSNMVPLLKWRKVRPDLLLQFVHHFINKIKLR